MSLDDGREGYSKNFGLRVGRLGSIEIWVHWVLIILLAILLLNNYVRESATESPFLSWLVFVGAILLSVLVHELAHCYAAFRQGGGANRIVLWPLGGLAYCSAPQQPRSQFWVAAAGPISDAAKATLAAGVCLGCDWGLFPTAGTESYWVARLFFQYLFLWNAFLLVLNLLPCLPLDGGRMLEALSWSVVESRSHATSITLRVSRITAFVALALGLILFVMSWANPSFSFEHPFLYHFAFGLVLMAIVHFAEARAIRHRLAYGEEEAGIFGYDFSQGYTSLERTAARTRKRQSLLAALRERYRHRELEQKRRKEGLLRERLDQLLEKIHRDGMESLSRDEQRFLNKASKELRK